MKKYSLLLAFSLFFLTTPIHADQAQAQRFLKVANQLVVYINASDYNAIDKLFSESMREFMPLTKNMVFFRNISTRYGKIQKLQNPWLKPPIQATFTADCQRGSIDMDLWLNDDNKIVGLRILPHKAGIPVPDRGRTNLQLPFKGQWLVFWGGDTKALNHHHDVRNQQFAFDFLGVDSKGATRKNLRNTNEDYYAFGREILAPADGIVTDVITGVRDNVPGSMNPYSALGNAVFIKHREHEISIIAHLKYRSIKVKVGDVVKAGQVIGLCGNSGNSSEPHLHYHLQNTTVIQEGAGIKCFFDKVTLTKNGKKTEKTDYSPIKDDIVAPAPQKDEKLE